MYNFFVDSQQRQGNKYIIENADHNHIKNVLRMSVGDTILVSLDGKSDLCIIEELTDNYTVVSISQQDFRSTELPVKIYLFQGLPKSDKMELIIQKTVELGVHAIIPTEMNRCVVRLDSKKKNSKLSRWQAISESAAKQSKRNIIPEICPVMSFAQALEKANELDLILIPYENKDGMKATAQALSQLKGAGSVGIFIGPEGGFEEKEIEKAVEAGGKTVSLGKRILRTETAAITSVAMCMLYIESTEDNL